MKKQEFAELAEAVIGAIRKEYDSDVGMAAEALADRPDRDYFMHLAAGTRYALEKAYAALQTYALTHRFEEGGDDE